MIVPNIAASLFLNQELQNKEKYQTLVKYLEENKYDYHEYIQMSDVGIFKVEYTLKDRPYVSKFKVEGDRVIELSKKQL